MDEAKAQHIINRIRYATEAVRALSIEELEYALNEVERFDAFAPFADPTKYLQRRAANIEFGRTLNALLTFRRALEATHYDW